MYSRLTIEGRSAAKITAKIVGITAALAFGMGEVAMVGRAVGDWWRQAAASAPVQWGAMPSYVSAPVTTPQVMETQPETAQFQPTPVAEVQLAPMYSVPQIVITSASTKTVRLMNSAHRPQQSPQRRYFTYPTNFQSGFHPNSGPR